MMKFYFSSALFANCLILACARAEEAKGNVLYESVNGSYRIEDQENQQWVVSTKNPAQREKLPETQPTDEFDQEFHGSPNDRWLFYIEGPRNHEMPSPAVYERTGDVKFVESKEFSATIEDFAVKNCGLTKHDFIQPNDRHCLETDFRGWSVDSSRVLLLLWGCEGDNQGYAYFNTRTKKFELTPYLRALNKIFRRRPATPSMDYKVGEVVCCEPVDPLPADAELKTRFETLDQQLNKMYDGQVKAAKDDEAEVLRQAQRTWMTARDGGLKIYLNNAPKAEGERRRLQFLGDAAAERIADLTPDKTEPD